MSIALRAVGLFCLIFFGTLFSITFVSPELIETSAKGFVKYQVEKEVRIKHQSIVQSTAAESAMKIAGKLGVEVEEIQDKLDSNLPEKVAIILASLCGYDCEKKKSITRSITSNYHDRIKSIQIAQDTLGDIIKGKYLEIIGNLQKDLRIFLGANLLMFFILIAVSFAKPQVVTHLFLPGILLLTATVLSSSIYIFGQDWFFTILYNDYMGFGYLAYIAVIFGFLLDIVLNKARATSQLINMIVNAVGSASSVGPC